MMKEIPTGDLKGVDAAGNKYYENLDTQIQGMYDTTATATATATTAATGTATIKFR
jgi:hypothetical protein